MSDAYAAATMTKREDILGHGLFEVFPDNPNDPSATGVGNLHASLRRILENCTPDIMAVQKYDIRRPDGTFEERYWSPMNSPVVGQERSVQYIIHRVEDVTELVRLRHLEAEQGRSTGELRLCADQIEAELFFRNWELAEARHLIQELKLSHKALHESEIRYRTLFENTRDGILIVNDEGRYVDVNDSFCRILKAPRERLVGAHFSDFIPVERITEAQKAFVNLKSDLSTPIDFPLRALDGSVVQLEWTSSSKYVPGLYFCACRDITDRKIMEASSFRLAAIVESSDDAIVGKDLSGIIQTWNRSAERIFGYTAEEVLGRHISILAAPDCVDEISNILQRISRGERVEHYETKRRKKDGQIIDVSLTVSPIRDPAGHIIGASKIVRDITERTFTEEALRSTNAALSRANTDLEQFAYSVSHDLQEPLRMVAMYSQMLKKKFSGKLGRDADEYIEYAVNGALRMEQLLKDLLVYTRVTSIKDVQLTPVDANQTVADAVANLQVAIQESGASIMYDRLPRVNMNPLHLLQIFQNLIGNAIKYRSNEPPSISVCAARRNKEWLFSVKDNGLGIQEQDADQIFGIFKRLHTPGTHPGTGIGLAICERLVQRYGGNIWVESQLGSGATFFFTIPDPAARIRKDPGSPPTIL